jgi:hypothetical protein
MEDKRYPNIEDKPMMAEDPIVAYPVTSYADAMAMIHTMHLSREDKERVGRRLVLETTEKNLSNAFDRLEHLSMLEPGWAGDGTHSVSRRAINNLKDVLLISNDDDWEYWMISPAPNGSLGLQSKRHTASISVGDKEFSFYSETDKGEDWGDGITFTPSAILDIMRRIV